MNIAQAQKKKIDEMLRLANRSPVPVFAETEAGQGYHKPEEALISAVTALQGLAGAVTLAGGDNITLTVAGQTITIAATSDILTGITAPTTATVAVRVGQFYLETTTPTLYQCTAIVDTTYTWTAIGGGAYTLLQATETILGGIKAKDVTTETSEVAIDPVTGKLFSNAPDEAANGLPAGGTIGQVPSKIDGTNYNVEWVTPGGGGGNAGPDSSIAGCTVWLKADAITGLIDGDAVPVWKDLVDGKEFGYVGTAPLYKTNIINSKPVIRFAGAGYFEGITGEPSYLFTFFIVSKFSSLLNNYTGLLHFSGVANLDGCIYIGSSGKSACYALGTTKMYDGEGAATYNTVNWNISSFSKMADGTFATRRNKTLDMTVAASLAYRVSSRGYCFLGCDPYIASRYFYGDMAEFILYNRALTSAEITTVENYLNIKYALGL